MTQVDEVIDGVKDVVKEGGEIADDLTTTREEELAILQAIHELDAKTDAWLPRNIRPLFLIFSCSGWLFTALSPTFGVEVPESAAQILQSWGEMAVIFYFGSRGAEKVMKTRAKSKLTEAKANKIEERAERKKIRLLERLKRKANR